MGITVAQALEIGGLGRSEIRAGRLGLQRAVEQVSLLSDALPARHQQVLYLTSAFALQQAPAAQCAQITALAEQQCAGLVLPPEAARHVSPEALSLADRLTFPLIELVSEVPFTEIVGALMGALMREQTAMLDRQRIFQQQLIDLMLRGFGLEHLVRATAQRLRRPVLVLGTHAEIESSYGLEPGLRDQWRQLIRQNRPARPRVFELAQEAGSAARIAVAPLPGTQRPGWIATIRDEQSDNEQQITIEQASAILALDLIKHESAAATRRNRQSELIEQLLSGRCESEERLLRDAEQLGWDLSRSRAVMIIRNTVSSADRRAQAPLRSLSDIARHACAGSIVAAYGDDVLVLARLTGGQQVLRDRLRELASELRQSLGEHGHQQCVIATGSLTESPLGLGASYQAACGALKLRAQLGGMPDIVHYDDAELLIMLSDFGARSDVQLWLRSQLGALIDYDQRNKTNLVYTLEVALDQGGVLNVTAEQLSIHPNTLKYRLQRVEEILGHNPLSSPHRLAYHIAAKLARLGM